MIRKMSGEYNPDYVSIPGITLKDTLKELNLTQAGFAKRTGRPIKTINEIIKGKTAITPETALQFEKVLGIPADFWNNREKQYRELIAKKKEIRKMEKELKLLEMIPVNEMVKFKWIKKWDNKVRQLEEVLKFFGIAGAEQWKQIWNVSSVAFRQSKAFQSNPGSVSSWLRKGEIEATQIQTHNFSINKFKKSLKKIRLLTNKEPKEFVPKMREYCAQAGVAVVFVPEIKGARVFGATRWLTSNKALIQLSLRYKTNDHLWFTFIHEAGHIILHGKRKFFIEVVEENNKFEDEANTFASNYLIPEDVYEEFIRNRRFSVYSIRKFSQYINIAPGIVVGRLQYDRHINYSYGNRLKMRLCWSTNPS